MDKLKLAEQTLVKEGVPNFRSGDSVNVHYRVREGEKERIQQFEGDVISRKGSGANQTFMVRKVSAGNIGVERIFPLNSPFIAKIEVKKEGNVRRSKLYYLRERSGKSARIKEKDQRKAEVEVAAEVNAEEAVENSNVGDSKDGQEKPIDSNRNDSRIDKKKAALKESKADKEGSETDKQKTEGKPDTEEKKKEVTKLKTGSEEE